MINKLTKAIKDIDEKFYYLFFTLFFKTIINLLLLFYVAKVTSIFDFGTFTLAFVIMTIGVLLIDYGYNLHALVLNYDNKDEVSKNISSIISGKILISMLLIFILLIIYFQTSLYPDSINIILLLAFAAIPNSFGNFLLSLFKANDQYRIETIGFLWQGLLLILILFINHKSGAVDIITLSIAVLISKIGYFIYSFIIFKREFKLRLHLSFESAVKSYSNSFSYGVHLIFGTLILYIETLFLSFFYDMETVGYYQSALRLIMAASLLGAIITDGFVPEIAKRLKDKQYVKSKMINLFNFLGVFYFLLLMTFGFYFNTILNILFSKEFGLIENYSVYILLIILFRAIGIVPGIILTGLGLQKLRAKSVMYSCFLSVILNIILVPKYGIEGAFISFLSTNILLNLIYVFFAIKEISFIKLIIQKTGFILLTYLILQFIFSIDSIYYLLLTLILNLIFQVFTQKKLIKINQNVTD
jgi:O-antigen/teichoic acid export membrane protein